jgi:hypothetical protein
MPGMGGSGAIKDSIFEITILSSLERYGYPVADNRVQ